MAAAVLGRSRAGNRGRAAPDAGEHIGRFRMSTGFGHGPGSRPTPMPGFVSVVEPRQEEVRAGSAYTIAQVEPEGRDPPVSRPQRLPVSVAEWRPICCRV